MNGDILFRTMPIGGFNKEDVLEYIGAQQQEIADLKKQCADKERMLQDARRRENALKAQLEDYKEKADEYFSKGEKYKKQISSQEKKIESLEKTISTIEIDFERTKDVEGQIGALVIDALLYSDKIIQSAKSSATEISTGTKETLTKAVSGVEEIGSDITEISENFGGVIEALSKKLRSLSADLTDAAESLDEGEEKVQEKTYVFGESTEVRMPALSEKDFNSQENEEEEEITQEEIDELLARLNITLAYNDETQESSEPEKEKEEISFEPERDDAPCENVRAQETPISVEVEEETLDLKEEPVLEEKAPAKVYTQADIDELLSDVDEYKAKKAEQDYAYRPSEHEIEDADGGEMMSEDISKLMDKFLDTDK